MQDYIIGILDYFAVMVVSAVIARKPLLRKISALKQLIATQSETIIKADKKIEELTEILKKED